MYFLMTEIPRRPGQENLAGATYRAINKCIYDEAVKMCKRDDRESAREIREYIQRRKEEYGEVYRRLGLNPREIKLTFKQLVNLARRAEREEGRTFVKQKRIDDSYTSGRDRRFVLRG